MLKPYENAESIFLKTGKSFSEYLLMEGLTMLEIPEPNKTNSEDKKINNFNKDNMNSNQDSKIFQINPDKVYGIPELTKKKRKREGQETKNSSEIKNKKSYKLRTTSKDKNRNDPSSEEYIIEQIKKQIIGEEKDKNIIFIITKETNKKKLGRKNKNSLEKGNHTKDDTDNINIKNWVMFFDLIRNSLIDIIKNYNNCQGLNIDFLKRTNVKKQLCPDNKKNLSDFKKKKLYNFLIYDPQKDENLKGHYSYGGFNNDIIEEMKNATDNKLFSVLLEEDIESIHRIFMQEEKQINIKENKYDLFNFKILIDYKEELKKSLEKDEKYSGKEIKDFIKCFHDSFDNLK